MDIIAIIAISLLGLVLVIMFVLLMIGIGSYNMSMSARSIAKKIAKANTKKNYEAYKIDHSWWDKHPSEILDIKSFDELTLYGHFIANPSCDKLAIIVHGYGGEYKDMNSYAALFLKRGYNILAVECRAHGNSEGDMVGMGWLDRLDILAWINKMLEINPNFKIALFGQSMGASAVCMSLGEKLPKNVICAISDCGFDNVYRQMYHVCHHHLKFLTKPTLNIFNAYLKRTKDYDMKVADGVRQLKKSHIPVLFIHGKADDFVPVEMCYRLSEAVPENRRDVLLVDNAGHIMSYATDEKVYTKAFNNFLDEYGM